jgi:hypothetical protein
VLTGRTHAWRPKTDLELCEKHIGFPPHTKALRWSRFLRQAVKVDLLTQRMIHHEDTQAVYS